VSNAIAGIDPVGVRPRLEGAGVVAAGRNDAALSRLGELPRVRPVRMSGDIEADFGALREAAGGRAHCALDVIGRADSAADTRATLHSPLHGGRLALMGSMTVPLNYTELLRSGKEIHGQFMYPRGRPPRSCSTSSPAGTSTSTASPSRPGRWQNFAPPWTAPNNPTPPRGDDLTSARTGLPPTQLEVREQRRYTTEADSRVGNNATVLLISPGCAPTATTDRAQQPSRQRRVTVERRTARGVSGWIRSCTDQHDMGAGAA